MDAAVLQLGHVGLDPVTSSSVKLYAQLIAEVTPLDEKRGIFVYKGHPFQTVDIIGRVVKIRRSQKFIKYQVDDGTGLVAAVCWFNDKTTTQHAAVRIQDAIGPLLKQRLESLLKEQDPSATPYCLGDLIHVQGKFKRVFDNLEISVNFHRKLSNPMHEVLRAAEMPILYKHIYKQPIKCPPLIQQQINTTEFNGILQAKVAFLVENILLQSMEVCNNNTCFNLQDLLAFAVTFLEQEGVSSPEVQHAVIAKAAHTLVKKGRIFSTNKESTSFMLVSKCNSLKEAVLQILSSHTVTNNDEENSGCPIMAIYRAVKQIANFAHITREAMLNCLTSLESDGDIISTAKNHYIVFNG